MALSRGDLAILEALLPAGAHPRLKGLLETRFREFYKDFERHAVPQLRLGFRAGLLAAAWAAPALIGRRPPLWRLRPEEREAALEAMAKSRVYSLRQLLLVLKAVAGFCYGADPEVRRALGYGAPGGAGSRPAAAARP